MRPQVRWWRMVEHRGHHRPLCQNQFLSFCSTRFAHEEISLQNPGWSWTAGCCFSTHTLYIISLSVTTDCCLKLINKSSQMDPRAHAQSVSSAPLHTDIWVMPVFYHNSWDFVFWNHQTVIKANQWRLSSFPFLPIEILFFYLIDISCEVIANLEPGSKGQKSLAFPSSAGDAPWTASPDVSCDLTDVL